MNKAAWWIGGGAVAVIGVCATLLAWWRVDEVRQFGRAYSVRTYHGTNYVFQFIATTVGKVETGWVVMVAARLENPHPTPLTLQRDWFVLVDDDKDYYLPVATSGQTGTITIPAAHSAEEETFTFVVPDDTLQGMLALSVGHQYFVTFKSNKPLSRPLTKGQYVTFRHLNW